MLVSCWGVSAEESGACEGVGGGVGDGVVARWAANWCTSSFRTRPSLPVPAMSDMLTESSFSRARTAGVARAACLEGGFGTTLVSTLPEFATSCS